MAQDDLRTTSPPFRAPRPFAAPRPLGAPAGDVDRAGRGASRAAAGDLSGRRTITIRGRGAERGPAVAYGRTRRRPERRHERAGFRPDRAALWAVLLGVLLIILAASSAHADVLHAV